MFVEGSESEQEKWAQSIANKGFHYERGVKLETFLCSHPIRGVIQEQNFSVCVYRSSGVSTHLCSGVLH